MYASASDIKDDVVGFNNLMYNVFKSQPEFHNTSVYYASDTDLFLYHGQTTQFLSQMFLNLGFVSQSNTPLLEDVMIRIV